MSTVTVHRHLDPTDRHSVRSLVSVVQHAQGFRPLSDDAWLTFNEGSFDRGYALLLRADDGTLEGYIQVDSEGTRRTTEIVTLPGDQHAAQIERLLRETLEIDLQPLRWWAFHATDTHARIALVLGLHPQRELLEMRRSLPAPQAFDVATRPFRPGVDEDDWLEVNNRAFAWHAEQSEWTIDDLKRRISEPWFDPAGFLLHEIDGRLAGFCWTKVHRELNPPVGEIYVIAVDPDFAGRGLGKALTLAGLESLSRHGLAEGMLFVDATNHSAVHMYTQLGFHVARTDVLFGQEIA